MIHESIGVGEVEVLGCLGPGPMSETESIGRKPVGIKRQSSHKLIIKQQAKGQASSRSAISH